MWNTWDTPWTLWFLLRWLRLEFRNNRSRSGPSSDRETCTHRSLPRLMFPMKRIWVALAGEKKWSDIHDHLLPGWIIMQEYVILSLFKLSNHPKSNLQVRCLFRISCTRITSILRRFIARFDWGVLEKSKIPYLNGDRTAGTAVNTAVFHEHTIVGWNGEDQRDFLRIHKGVRVF